MSLNFGVLSRLHTAQSRGVSVRWYDLRGRSPLGWSYPVFINDIVGGLLNAGWYGSVAFKGVHHSLTSGAGYPQSTGSQP